MSEPEKGKDFQSLSEGNRQGLVAEFVAPRLWEDPRGIDGGFTSNDPAGRAWAVDRLKRCADIANALGTKLIVLWLAREGTYLRESKDIVRATHQLLEAVDALLAPAQGGRTAFFFQLFDDFFHGQTPLSPRIGAAAQAAGRRSLILSRTSRAARRMFVPGP